MQFRFGRKVIDGCGVTLGALCLSASVSVTHRQEPPPASGIIPSLTAEDYEQAKSCGRAGPQCAITPYQVCSSENIHYIVSVATPFSRVATAVLEGMRTGRPGRGMDRGNANRWGTGVYVLPAELSIDAAGIERIEIQRDERTVQPLTTTVGPVAVRMPDGSSKQLTRGYFAFPADAFTPTTDIKLVLSGPGGIATCTVDRPRLRGLR
jgi:hypothetical protein